MPKKVIIFIIVLLTLLVFGMIRYGVLWQNEQTLATTQASIPATNIAPIDLDLLPDGVRFTESFVLPVPGSVRTDDLLHTINLEDIRRGCLRQDCIPSIENPQFAPASELQTVLDPESLGIVLWDAQRFYPFPMLETHELVNETLPDGSAVLISYCPLCGTGIVFNREIDGEPIEFGVTGMLWQSNLLMYNRATDIADQNLWSQILGQAVVGDQAGKELQVLESDIITFGDWLERYPQGETLVSGPPEDPYNGQYYDVALNFAPDYDPSTSTVAPDTYVHGIIVNGQPKAYVSADLVDGMTDIVSGERIFVINVDSKIRFVSSNAEKAIPPTHIPDVEGFWFSWQAAHPTTELWTLE